MSDYLTVADKCACILHADGSLAKPYWAHWLQMLRTVFHRTDI